MTVTAAYDPGLSRVQISASGLPGAYATIERSLNGTMWTTVRGGTAVPITAGALTLDDYEFVSDRPNRYRVTPHDYVTGFEGGIAGWEGIGGTLSASSAQAHSGTGSALITPDGVTADVRVATTIAASPPVVAGVTYDLSVWVYHELGRDVDLSVRWLDASDVQISWPFGPTFSVPADTWTRLYGSFTAPTAAAKGKLHINQRSTPSAANLLYVDDVLFTGVVFPAETAIIAPSLAGQVWLKSIRYPGLNRPIVVTGWSSPTRPSKAGLFDVVGRAAPVAVEDARGSRRWTLTVTTETPEHARTLDLILAAGDTMLIHVPADCPVPGGYVTIGDTAEDRGGSVRSPRRHWSLPCTTVAAPGPDVVGGTMTWGAVLVAYGDWNNVIAANPTWGDLVARVASVDDVVPL